MRTVWGALGINGCIVSRMPKMQVYLPDELYEKVFPQLDVLLRPVAVGDHAIGGRLLQPREIRGAHRATRLVGAHGRGQRQDDQRTSRAKTLHVT